MDTSREQAAPQELAAEAKRRAEEVKRLVRQLSNASYNHGYEDAHPGNATTRQDKADAKVRELLKTTAEAIDALAAQAAPQATAEPGEALSDEQIDRVLSAVVPGGSAARDWFLPHELERGLRNVRDVVRCMLSTAAALRSPAEVAPAQAGPQEPAASVAVPPSDWLKRIEEEGRTAGHQGKSKLDNPYDRRTTAGQAWELARRGVPEYVVFATPPAETAASEREALKTIAEWRLPQTGKFWPSGAPISYETEYGSNGARDYMRKVAQDALAARAQAPAAETASPGVGERELFESTFAGPRGWDLSRDKEGYYLAGEGRLEAMWKSWEARAALAAAPSTPSAAEPVAQEPENWFADLTQAKRLLVDIHQRHPETRALIEARTGSWFVWGQDRAAPPQPPTSDAQAGSPSDSASKGTP